MRVVVHVSAFYNWEPIPADVKVTEADIKSGRVKPAADGGMTMRVTRKQASHTTVLVPEHEIIARALFELVPRPGLRKLGAVNRREALAELLDANIMPEHAHPKHFLGFEVENDDGPDEAAFRAELARIGEATHHITGEPLVDPSEVEAIVAKYLEPVTHAEHVNHLHARFKVAKRAS